MQYRKMGNTGVEVSALGFGCMTCPFGLDIPGIYGIYNQTVNDSRAVTVEKYASLAK